MRLPAFDFHSPSTVEEALELKARLGSTARLMAGGTDLLPRLRAGRVTCRHVIGLKGVDRLRSLAFDDATGLTIGATALLVDVAGNPPTRQHFPMLVDAISRLATVQVRNKATVAGNLCNASPCADTATPLMAFGARAGIVGPAGRREVSVEGLITGPGKTVVGDDELLESIQVPMPRAGLRTRFTKCTPRSRVDISAVSVSVALTLAGDRVDTIDIFLGTVAPTPMRAANAESVLRGKKPTPELLEQAARTAQGECRPVTDFRATKEYKLRMVYVLTRRILEELTERR